MHRIDAPGHASNLFTEGNPGLGTPATQVSDDWLNDVQEELAKAIEAAGITLVKGTTSQLLTALKTIGLFGGVSGGGIGQIKFPATQNASADANTVDDYERGSWTPILGGATSQTGQTYTNQVGRYQKVGDRVHIWGGIILSAKGTITGVVQVKGLPFAAVAAGDQPCTISYWLLSTSWTWISAFIAAGGAAANVIGTQGAAATHTALVAADIANATSILFHATYQTTA